MSIGARIRRHLGTTREYVVEAGPDRTIVGHGTTRGRAIASARRACKRKYDYWRRAGPDGRAIANLYRATLRAIERLSTTKG